MKRSLVIFAMVFLAGAHAQPIECQEDVQCSTGRYCSPEEHSCLPCLSCQSLKREPPPLASNCVKYVSECGPCLKGLVASVDGSALCIPAESGGGLPPYLWAIIVLAALIFVGFVSGVLFYVLRHTETFKILTSATSVETQRSPRELVPATAPPPYNGHYEPVRPSSPPPPDTAESEAPLVKRVGSNGVGGGGARESAASQAARVFNNPAYVRGPHLPSAEPPSYSEALSDDDGWEPQRVFVPPPDEDTMESVWTPDHSTTHAEPSVPEVTTVAEASGSSSANARRPERSECAPPAKVHCVREDTNNNRGGGGGGESSSSARLPPASSLVINVLNVNTIRPLNDLSL